MILITEDNHIKMIDYRNHFARQFSKDTHLGMVTKAETKEELDKYYREYLNMTIKQKFKANNMALRIFGMTNDELYQLYLKDFVKDDYNSYVHLGYNGFEPINNNDSKDNITDYVKDYERGLDDKQDVLLGINRDNIPNEVNNEIIVRDIDRDTFVGRIQESMYLKNIEEEQAGLINTSFFTPYEILSFGEDFYSSTPDNTKLTEDISVSEWFTNYVESFNGHVCENLTVEWIEKMRSLYANYNRILESGDEQAINNRKQSILNLGWNPEIDFNEKNILIGKQRLREAAKHTQDIYKDYSNITISEETVLTEAIDETKYSGVFIVLTKGKTPIVSDSISFFTNSEYTHAGIAFDEELDEIYSFNMKKDTRGNNGFVIENIRNDECIQSVYVLFVERNKVKQMISQVKDFEVHKTTYDFGLLVGKAVSAKHNNKESRKYNQVCSSFVDTILHYGEVEFIHTKNKSIASPADIYNSISKTSNKIFKIFEGSGKSYSTEKTRKILNSLIQHSKTVPYTEDYIEEKAKPNLCYKVTYEGSSDIFQELKMVMFNEDRGMRTFDNFYDKKCTWLKPEGAKGKIFLKDKGLKKFKKDILPTINAYLDKKKVKVDSYSVENDKITYNDDYVIATSKALVKVTEDYNYIEEISSSEQFQVMQKYSAKVQRYADTIGYNRTNIVVRLYFDETDYAYQKFEPVDVKKDKANVLDYIDENTYVISDPHFTKFDDNYDKQMLKLLSSVPEDATMIILGDIGYLKTDNPKAPELIRKYFKQIKCKNMFLVLGNHDVHRLDYYYNLGFKGIYERIIDNKHKWTFSHQPFNGDSSISDYINLHGHIHAETRYPKGIKDLSTEINCWSGYCTNGKIKTIREWLSFGNTIRNTYLEGVLLDDSYDAVSEMQVRESYSMIGMYVEEDVQDYMESKDRAYNLDKWESKKANVIYITGASGSGKSTIAKKIAEEYGAEWVPLDVFFKYGVKKNENREFDEWILITSPTIVEYINKIGRKNIFSGAEIQSWNDMIDEKNSDKVRLSLKKLFAYLESKSSPNKRFAVEGFQIGAVYDASDLSGKPLIVKGNSFAKTQYRRIKREFDKGSRGKTFADKTKNAASMVKDNIQYAVINKKEYGIIDDFDKNFRNESTSIDEAVSMDDEGNMLIYRATLNTINYGDEIKKSSDLCKLYKESSNIEGLKYELCKLWYINAMLEKRIKRNDSKKDEYMNNRRICLNIFKTYMKHVLTLDDDFNFEAFYNTTPFSGAIRIDKNTLKYSVKALKELMR